MRKIEFVGLDKVDQQRIKNEISVVRGDVLDPYVINRNLKRIESLGFFSNVSSKQENYEGGVKWIITLVENPVLQQIKFIGNESINAEDLTSNLTSKVDELFNYNKTREDISKIEAKYKDEGFILSKVNKVDLPTLSNPTLTFFIQESEINAISVTGNTKTKDYVILRELDLEKGQKINEIELRKNLGRVYNLNYFSEVIPDLQPSISTKNVYDLIISVEEKSTDSVNFGGGWGQRSGGFLYSDLNINNFLGTGQLIALRGQWGNDLQTYQFKYHNPWMFGKRKSFTYRAWNTRGNFGFNNTVSTGYRPETRYGMDAAVGLPHSYELRSNHKVKLKTFTFLTHQFQMKKIIQFKATLIRCHMTLEMFHLTL